MSCVFRSSSREGTVHSGTIEGFIQQYCLDKGWIIVNEFIEKEKLAKTDDYPEFRKMIALAKRSNRPFDAVVAQKFDRFSRKRDDHVIYKALLNQCG